MLRLLLKEMLPFAIPVVGVGVLLGMPTPSLQGGESMRVLVSYGPLLLLGLCGLLSLHFRSPRYLLASWLFGFSYVYAMGCTIPMGRCPPFFGGPEHLNSLVALPILLPLNALVLHLVPEASLERYSGVPAVALLGLQFVLLRWGYPLIMQGTGGSPIGSVRDLVVYAPGLLLVLAAVSVIWLYRPRSFYGLYPTPLAAAVIAGVLPFQPAVGRLGPGAYPLVLPVLFTAAAGSLAAGVLVLARNRAFRDPLTRLRGHDSLRRRLRAAGGSLILVLIELYDFASFQETYGHEAGDRVLTEVGDRIRSTTAGTPFHLRRGRFALVFEGWDRESVRSEVGRLQEGVEALEFHVTRTGPRAEKVYRKGVSLRVGIVERNDEERAQELVERAEEALRKARSDSHPSTVEE